MFFSKKSHPEEENVAKKGIKHIDKVVTGLILWWLIASIYGIKKSQRDTHKEEKEPTEMTREDPTPDVPKKLGEKWLLRRIIFGNK